MGAMHMDPDMTPSELMISVDGVITAVDTVVGAGLVVALAAVATGGIMAVGTTARQATGWAVMGLADTGSRVMGLAATALAGAAGTVLRAGDMVGPGITDQRCLHAPV